MDAIRQRVAADLGQADADYIRGIVKAQRAFEGAGRALFYLPPAWPLAVASLSISKILDNMEIGHNVMHGQYDWMGDPALNSRMYEWDTVCPSEQWKYSHNYIHHTYTNILGKDRDIGYGILRMDEDQKWRPYYLGNPVYAFLLMTFFQWGVRCTTSRSRTSWPASGPGRTPSPCTAASSARCATRRSRTTCCSRC